VSPDAEAAALRRDAIWPGLVLAILITGTAYGLQVAPAALLRTISEAGLRRPISAAVIAILVGMVVRTLLTTPRLAAGCRLVVRWSIPPAIVLTGAGLNLGLLRTVGFPALAVTASAIVIGLASGYLVSRALGLGRRTAVLIGAGTGICGTSAIVTIAPLIDAKDDEMVLAIGTVNLMGLLAMLALPVAGSWWELNDEAFGVWAGATVHAVPQAVAAGMTFSPGAGEIATLVKLVRVTMLAPVVFLIAMTYARSRAHSDGAAAVRVNYFRLVPWFIWGFLALSIANTLGWFGTITLWAPLASSSETGTIEVSIVSTMKSAGEFLLTLAMAAIGLQVNIRSLVSVGGPAIVSGMIAATILAASSLVMIRAMV